ncbi:MAG: right-handed parallel beta-helix repeat-containing protein [Pseudomonadota bacterium]
MTDSYSKLGAGETARHTASTLCRRTLVLFTLTGVWLTCQANDLPGAPQYLGEVRRDASGRLVTVPSPAAGETATRPSGKVLKVGPNQEIRLISTAAKLAQDGDTVEIEAGDYPADVAVWKQNDLTIRGVGGRPRLIAAGASAEGKGIWVIRGGRIVVENLEFTGARVPDRNGAGIRFERGHLIVRNCRFHDNENGILSGSGNMMLEIEDSEFGHNGAGDGYSHNLYVGAIQSLRVTGSYFHHAKAGHLLKSRAAENFILYNRLTDETGGRASYELEFPNGGIAYVIGNIIQQNATPENAVLISYGAEGYKHAANQLYLINNTMHDERPQGGYFLVAKPGFQVVKTYNNLLIGKRPLNSGGIDGEFVNNPNVEWEPFVLPQRHDYRIKRESPLHRTWRDPGSANGFSLVPVREYVHPASTRPLTTTPTLPGAKQTLQPDNSN